MKKVSTVLCLLIVLIIGAALTQGAAPPYALPTSGAPHSIGVDTAQTFWYDSAHYLYVAGNMWQSNHATDALDTLAEGLPILLVMHNPAVPTAQSPPFVQYSCNTIETSPGGADGDIICSGTGDEILITWKQLREALDADGYVIGATK